MRKATIFLVTFLAAGWLVSGCGDDDGGDGFGSAKISWQVLGSSCTVAGIIDVKVALKQDGATMLSSEPVRCGDGSMVFPEVPVGTYEVRVLGFNEDNQVTHEGLSEGLDVGDSDIPAELDQPVSLDIRAGIVKLRWTFPAAGSGLCAFNNVAEVEVNVSQTSTKKLLFQEILPCDPDPEDLDDGWFVISDVPPGEVDLVLFGLSPDGDRVSTGNEQLTVGDGENNEVLITLEPCAGGSCV